MVTYLWDPPTALPQTPALHHGEEEEGGPLLLTRKELFYRQRGDLGHIESLLVFWFLCTKVVFKVFSVWKLTSSDREAMGWAGV